MISRGQDRPSPRLESATSASANPRFPSPAAASLPGWLRLLPASIVLWLAASWPIGLTLDPARLSKPGELAYLVADLAILLPLALMTALSLRRPSVHAAVFLVATLGALAYDATHFAVRTAQELSSSVARLAVVAALALLLAIIGLGLRAALRHLTASRRS